MDLFKVWNNGMIAKKIFFFFYLFFSKSLNNKLFVYLLGLFINNISVVFDSDYKKKKFFCNWNTKIKFENLFLNKIIHLLTFFSILNEKLIFFFIEMWAKKLDSISWKNS